MTELSQAPVREKHSIDPLTLTCHSMIIVVVSPHFFFRIAWVECSPLEHRCHPVDTNSLLLRAKLTGSTGALRFLQHMTACGIQLMRFPLTTDPEIFRPHPKRLIRVFQYLRAAPHGRTRACDFA